MYEVGAEQESHKIPSTSVPELNTEQEHIPLTSCSSPGTATGIYVLWQLFKIKCQNNMYSQGCSSCIQA